MRTDTCDFTREGITVGSRRVGRLSTFTNKRGTVYSLLLGPDTCMLWTVNEGSRHFDERDSVDRFVIEAIRSYNSDSS